MIKNELLCYGVNCNKNIFNKIKTINPYASSNKSVHAAFFLLDNDVWVNSPINETYTRNSPYSIRFDKDQFVLYKSQDKICKITIPNPPKWYEQRTLNGTKMYDVLCVHSKNVLSLTHYISCYYSKIGKKCLYCSVTENKTSQLLDIEIRKQDIVETLIEALKENSDYSLALSEGVKNRNDRGAVYFSSILKKILESNILIKSSVELAPPKNDAYIDLLYSSGATSIIMNIEFYDDNFRRAYCPGKGEIDTKRYFEALNHSVKIFGMGNVASVLIAGIEPMDNTIKCAQLLLDSGVLPIIIPFKPYDNCNLSISKTTSPENLALISEEIDKYFKSKNFSNICNGTCISCGACNVDYYLQRNDKVCLKEAN